jgi:hypothetical protein
MRIPTANPEVGLILCRATLCVATIVLLALPGGVQGETVTVPDRR